MYKWTLMAMIAIAFSGNEVFAAQAPQDSQQTAQTPPNPPQQTSDPNKQPYLGSQRFGFDPTVIQPGTHAFFPTGTLDPGEIELFKDGKLAVDLQLVGGDLVHYFRDGKARVGVNLGLGITQLNDAAVVLTSTSAFCQIGAYYRIDFGWTRGQSAKEGLTPKQRDRDALFVGISFPTKLNELLKSLLK